ncbi:MAG: DUF305 domain-containing protein [Aquamicrobium sp.]|uniref:DUF305 domain-containing protein n=1 Tax=Aquamicrobium sp. TaxID=1872579 RepID=UPI00349E5F02|nr:DUF305 domain-containing protein [Aquamicrobium sp.]
MPARILRFSAIALAACLAAAPAALAQDGHGAHSHGAGASQAYMDAMTSMNEEMEKMEMTGEAGIDFALMMIPHHQSAIDMARAYLDSGENDPELTKLSQDIVAAQESEIAFLRAWLAKNGH